MQNDNPLKHIPTLAMLIALSIAGAIIGIQLLCTLGITPSTSIIGALLAMLLSRRPGPHSATTAPSTPRTWRRP